MKSDDIAIKVDGVSKNFRLPHEKSNTLKSAVLNIVRGKHNRTVSTQHALRDISFEIKKGEFFGIVGRNGSGKSTMLKILAGIYQPTKGLVRVEGKLVPFIELGVGFNPELTGRENVYLNGSLLGFSKSEIDAMYDEIVEFAELAEFMDQRLKNYSSGMQVRLAFSMAIRAQADVLLVDEVLAVGDADFQRKCFDYFRELKRAKKTVIFVSHDMSAVREYCDRAILIEKSKLILEGTSATVATAYTKMFTPDGDERMSDANQKRWGDKGMQQTKVTVTPKVCKEEDTTLTVEVTFTAHEETHNPVFGILIKHANGTHITGTNTKLKYVHTGSYKPGQKGTISWTVPNIFNDGKYLVDAAISHEDAVSQYDWWEDATGFTVYKDERTPYIVNPKTDVKLEQSSK